MWWFQMYFTAYEIKIHVLWIYVWCVLIICTTEFSIVLQVVELLSKDGRLVQVSLWIRQLDNDGPCLVVAEPVSCKNVVVSKYCISCYNLAIAYCHRNQDTAKNVSLSSSFLLTCQKDHTALCKLCYSNFCNIINKKMFRSE